MNRYLNFTYLKKDTLAYQLFKDRRNKLRLRAIAYGLNGVASFIKTAEDLDKLEAKLDRLQDFKEYLNTKSTLETAFMELLARLKVIGWVRNRPLGGYFLDFYFYKQGLALEIDGPSHNSSKKRKLDDIRTQNLNNLGIEVVRFNYRDKRQWEYKLKLLITKYNLKTY